MYRNKRAKKMEKDIEDIKAIQNDINKVEITLFLIYFISILKIILNLKKY